MWRRAGIKTGQIIVVVVGDEDVVMTWGGKY